MTIKQLSEDKVLIRLCADDMKNFALEYEKMGFTDKHSKLILLRLLKIALCNFEAKNQNKILMEAIPDNDGCFLLLTLQNERSNRKKYKIKRVKDYPCYRFENCDELLKAIEMLYKNCKLFYNNSAFELKGKYYLVFDYPVVPKNAKMLLKEYSACECSDKIFLSHLYEHANVLSSGNAIEHIGCAL